MKASTSAVLTSAGSFPANAKNTFKSNAAASTVFGLHRAATNRRYSSTSSFPSRTSTPVSPRARRSRHGTQSDMQDPPVPGRGLPYRSLPEPAGDHLHIVALLETISESADTGPGSTP